MGGGPGSSSIIFRTSKLYPLTEALAKVPEFQSATRRKSWKKCDRIDIVSPSLCDDAIQYLAPRLETYRGCDVIDINPGACLWSQTIHRFLQPRRHLLLEPETGYYENFIKPLTEQTNSKYRYSTLWPTHPTRYWQTYQKIFNDELLPKRQPLSPDDPALRKPNRTLLITGNLHRLYKESDVRHGIAFPSCLTLSHMMHAAHMNTLFHSYGLVKMLFWLPAEARGTVLPWHDGERVTYNATSDVLVDMAEIAGVPRRTEGLAKKSWAVVDRQRLHLMDSISSLRVADTMKKNGIKMPEHRIPDTLKAAQKNRDKIEKMSQILHLPVVQDTPANLEGFENSVMELEAEVARIAGNVKTVHLMKLEPISAKYRYLIKNGVFDPLDVELPNRFLAYIEHSIRLIQAEIGFVRLSSSMDDSKKEEYRERFRKINADVRRIIAQGNTSAYLLWEARAARLLTDILGCYADSPVLAIDRRPFEPLAAKEDEFWPQTPMMLLEVDPREKPFASECTRANKTDTIMRDFFRMLLWKRSVHLDEALDSFAPEAGTDLPPETKSMHDPTKGGRLDYRMLKPANLTREMLAELIDAYCEWPFKPTDAEMRESSGNMTGRSEGDEENSEDQSDDEAS
ncbi:S-adenosyl-L-methionine-dependent methyltransferase [Myriangium duriaei CBS 260.36]|uniref:S-adenosyl-L-methionine-dependent methyltransferase n=1 Tax=Myriangium duriaei CBS 260.36 TaxID=1168546 RepID=A0A9P4J8P7_9PEZI|nr:S-adenosyl-L-methionine-dependent methyltransferase [Myriangium duriaei CBS 260.36]